jgi:CcmD family protein
MDNLIFIVAAFAIVWSALFAYLISLRARGA